MNGTKQTAANNKILKLARRAMNKPIFKRATAIMNAEGEAATLAYLQIFFKGPVIQAMQSLAKISQPY